MPKKFKHFQITNVKPQNIKPRDFNAFLEQYCPSIILSSGNEKTGVFLDSDEKEVFRHFFDSEIDEGKLRSERNLHFPFNLIITLPTGFQWLVAFVLIYFLLSILSDYSKRSSLIDPLTRALTSCAIGFVSPIVISLSSTSSSTELQLRSLSKIVLEFMRKKDISERFNKVKIRPHSKLEISTKGKLQKIQNEFVQEREQFAFDNKYLPVITTLVALFLSLAIMALFNPDIIIKLTGSNGSFANTLMIIFSVITTVITISLGSSLLNNDKTVKFLKRCEVVLGSLIIDETENKNSDSSKQLTNIKNTSY